jgi:hypothetical protein
MNSRRARFIAIQTLLTVVLMGVIVVTLINPKNESSLFAVDVPGTAPSAQEPPSNHPGGREGGGPGRAEGGPANDGTDAGTGAATEPAPAGATEPSVPGGTTVTQPPVPGNPPSGGGNPPGGGGPPGEQYDDTLARLSDAIN